MARNLVAPPIGLEPITVRWLGMSAATSGKPDQKVLNMRDYKRSPGVTNSSVTKRKSDSGTVVPIVNVHPVFNHPYALSEDWESAIGAWITWLRIAGIPSTTIRLRRGHIRMVARTSQTKGPAHVDLGVLVRVCSEHQWSNEHRRGVRRSLIMFFEWAISEGRVDENPAVGLPKVPGGTPNPRPCPEHLWSELVRTAPPREKMMVRLAGELGMRRAEVAVCHRDDLLRDSTGFALLVHGKGGRQRLLPITDSLAHAIIAFCPGGYLFPGQENGHLSAHYVGKLIGNRMPQGWSMHKLRHRFATLGLAATGDLLAMRDALGHASVATTQLYTASYPGKVRDVVEAVAAPLPPHLTSVKTYQRV
ncbi:integrase [Mycobacteroides abscessus subsp. massiliense]|nr:integrase [Mycobacteroides abscessus subsp. massiliense]